MKRKRREEKNVSLMRRALDTVQNQRRLHELRLDDSHEDYMSVEDEEEEEEAVERQRGERGGRFLNKRNDRYVTFFMLQQ